MTATQDSNGPLPLPIRVSNGFLVNDFCGKMRIHILPWRFMLRAIATRAASICLVSSQHRSSAINPYSPNATVLPRYASPARLPRCILRYFTRSGIKGISNLSLSQLLYGRGRLGFGSRPGDRRLLVRPRLALANPALDSQLAVNRVRFGKSVVDVRAQRVQGHAAP